MSCYKRITQTSVTNGSLFYYTPKKSLILLYYIIVKILKNEKNYYVIYNLKFKFNSKQGINKPYFIKQLRRNNKKIESRFYIICI